jgi:UDP-N-acetyl-D-mannosaminuronic acid dehydrogenase
MTVPEGLGDRSVCVVGLGYVGLTLAVAMADSGLSVLGIEVKQDVLDKLGRIEPHFHEPRLKDKLARVLTKGSLRVGASVDPAFDGTVFIITVGTPLDAEGQIALRFVEQAARQVREVLKDGDLVILRSTVKIGTARNIVRPILAESGKRFDLAVCPERTLEGRALLELHALPQIIGADEANTRFRCGQLFSMLTPTIVSVSSLEAGELVKLIDNTYRDVSFGFANEVAKLCARLGVSASEVISAAKLAYPRTDVAWPGPVGGPCLEKDPHILASSAAEHGVEMGITVAARRTNERQPGDAVRLIAARARHLPGFAPCPRIAVLGLAFKGVPETDDLRGTMARPILRELKANFSGADIVGFDAVVPREEARAALGIEVETSVAACFTGADLVVIANNHPSFRAMDLATLAQTMNRPGLVYDFWNQFDDIVEAMPEAVAYVGLGSEDLPRIARVSVGAARRYLVTGGTGFIGSALVRRLVEDGHAVRVVDNDQRGRARRIGDLAGRLELVACDVRDADAVAHAARGADCILHLAALNGTENFYKSPDLVLDIGVKGMLAVLHAAEANAIPELVLASSSEAYQSAPVVPTPEDVPLTIGDPWNPRYSYAGSKIVSEIMLGSYNRDLFKRAIIFRPHNVYGPDMGFEHVLPQLVMRAANGARRHPMGKVPFEIQGDGSQTRSFINIADCVEALSLILRKGGHREVYHVGTEDEVTIRELAAHVFAQFDREFELVPGPLPAGGTLRRCPSIAKISALGFEPRLSLAQGVAGLARWYLDNSELWPHDR